MFTTILRRVQTAIGWPERRDMEDRDADQMAEDPKTGGGDLNASSSPQHDTRSNSSDERLLNGSGNDAPMLTSTPASPVHAAPHGGSQVGLLSGSSSARHSPTPSDDEGGRRSQSQARLTPSGPSKRSHRSVPRGYRGPVPLEGDAEEIAARPALVHVPTLSSDAYNVVNYPLNRNGWRYTAAGPATQLLSFGIYRTLETEPRGVHWSWSDRSQYTQISDDASTVTTDGGFRSVRANIPVRSGSWYCEVHVLPPETTTARSCKGSAHVRVGWARREAGLNAPVGCNGYSYGMRDTSGEKVFLARTYKYGKPFGVGDVIGMWMSLPEERQVSAEDRSDPAIVQRKRLPIRYKGRLYFESLEYAPTKEMDQLMDRSRKGEKLHDGLTHGASVNASDGLIAPTAAAARGRDGRKKSKGGAGPPGSKAPARTNLRSLPTLGPESRIGFFINGEPQGVAFENLFDYRPLALARSGKEAGAKKSKKAAGPDVNDLSMDSDVITASSTAASILKSRENHHDDGALGYFPFVSLYGGAKAKLVTRAEEFRFCPPDDIAQQLYAADVSAGRMTAEEGATKSSSAAPRPLDERFDEYMSEMLHHDIADEGMWRALILKRQAEEDDDESDASHLRAHKKGAKKSRAGGAVAALKGRSESTPLREGKLESSDNDTTLISAAEATTGTQEEIEQMLGGVKAETDAEMSDDARDGGEALQPQDTDVKTEAFAQSPIPASAASPAAMARDGDANPQDIDVKDENAMDASPSDNE